MGEPMLQAETPLEGQGIVKRTDPEFIPALIC